MSQQRYRIIDPETGDYKIITKQQAINEHYAYWCATLRQAGFGKRDLSLQRFWEDYCQTMDPKRVGTLLEVKFG